MRPFDGRRILLVVSGGIAAYKSAYLTRRLIEADAVVDVVLTAGAQHFVGPTTFEGLTGRRVYSDLWSRPMAHLDLGRDADVAILAPATADILSKLARGAADDLATATLLAAGCPVVVCPAMNTRMWKHPATAKNMAALREFGYDQVGPVFGALAEGEVGDGRMAEPDEIVAALGRILEPDSSLTGTRVVVTAGPTRAPLDPVRFLGNRSSGKMGFALASAAWRRGAEVTVITGPGHALRPRGPRVVEVETAREMLSALETELDEATVLLMAAAVADFEPASVAPSKIKKGPTGGLSLELDRAPDLLASTRELRKRTGILSVGFALETEDALENGRAKLEAKGLDLIAINVAGEPGAGFDVETNRVTLLDRLGHTEELPLMLKEELADRLLDRVEEVLSE
jgi:phosphopantothenoylcysteine decarboxylase/phosphopantothenate--cysteine ligase